MPDNSLPYLLVPVGLEALVVNENDRDSTLWSINHKHYTGLAKLGPVEPPPFARAGTPFVDPWGCVWETSEDGIVGLVTKHPLGDWAALAGYVPPDPNGFNHFGRVDWDDLKTAVNPAGFIKHLRAGEVGHGHTFLKLCDLRGYENLLCDMAVEDARLWRLIEMVEAFNMGLVHNFLDRVGAPVAAWPDDRNHRLFVFDHGNEVFVADLNALAVEQHGDVIVAVVRDGQ